MKKLLLSLLGFLFILVSVNASENKIYFVEQDNKLVYETDNVDNVFMNHIDMLPGSSYSDELTIQNGTSKTYKLYLKAQPREQSQVANELIDNISMNLYLDGTLIYSGMARGLDYTNTGVNLQDAIVLKDFAPNDSSVLKADITLSTQYSNTDSEMAYVDWTFYAQYEDENKPDDPGPTDPEPTDPEPSDPEPSDPVIDDKPTPQEPIQIIPVPKTDKDAFPFWIVSLIICLVGASLLVYVEFRNKKTNDKK